MERWRQIAVPWHFKPFFCGIGVAVSAAVLSWLWLQIPAAGVGGTLALVYLLASLCCFTWAGIFAYQMDK